MLPTLSYTASGQSTQLSCSSTHFSPTLAATAATWRVWLDCTPPMDTRVSQPVASASAMRYSSLRVLLPPKAMPGVAVLPFGPQPRAAQVFGEAGQRVDGGGAEQQRISVEILHGHGSASW